MHAERVSATFSDWKLYMGAGEVIPEGTVPLDCLDQPFVSKKFQWLPADIIVDSNGSVKFLSYINTMHPQWHAPLYAATAPLLQRMLPLFERVLAAAAVPQHRAVSPPEKIWVPDAEAGGGAEVAACRPWAPPCAQLFWPAAEPSAQLAAESPAWRGSCCQLNTVVRDDD